MPSADDKYKSEPLVQLALELRDGHKQLKELLHKTGVRYQEKIPPRKDFQSNGTVFTQAKNHSVRLAKIRDKKHAQANKVPGSGKIRVVKVDDKLIQFVGGAKRGFTQNMYSDTAITSFFTNWATANNRLNGREVKLYGDTDEFVKLFKEDLQRLGSGPTIKKTGLDKDGKKVVLEETKTAVLDENGKQINPFHMNKHMFVFASHYPQKAKSTGTKFKPGREVVSKEDYPEVYEKIKLEHKLLTVDLKEARKKYKDALESLEALKKKKEKAQQVGDRSINENISRAESELKFSKQQYVQLMNQNKIQHNIV